MTAESSLVAPGENPSRSRADTPNKAALSIYFRRSRKADATSVTSHWGHLLENFSFSSNEFYQRVEKALQRRDVPQLTATRVVWNEGGLLSPRREYLRVQRGRSAFDICAAPFGSGFFVSSWAGDKPLKLGWLLLLLLFIAFLAYGQNPSAYPQTYHQQTYFDRQMGTWQTHWVLDPVSIPHTPLYYTASRYFTWEEFTRAMKIIFWATLLGGLGLVVFYPDATLMRIPLVGYVYVRYFRRITYYRVDVHACYEQAVHAAVLEVIDELTKTHGLRPLSETERASNHRDFFNTLMPHARRS